MKIDIEGHELDAAATEAVSEAIADLGYPQVTEDRHQHDMTGYCHASAAANAITTMLPVLLQCCCSAAAVLLSMLLPVLLQCCCNDIMMALQCCYNAVIMLL